MNTVFDLKPIRHGPATGNEKVHEFFEREGRPEAAPIRDWIEHWYGQLPPAKQPDMRGRLRSDDIHQFTSAYFELQMFAMLRTMEYEVTVEPTLAAGRYNPDFLARREDETFYLEATVCGQDAGDLRATRNDEDAVEKIRAAFEYEKVNIHSHLWLQAEGALSDTISANKITRAFADLMRRTTAAEVHRSHESDPHHHQHRTQYREQFEYGDWRLEGFLEPKLHKDAAGHVWGPARSAVGDATESIRTSLADKARPWRKMGPPDGIFVVAMSICHGQYFWNDGDETRAIAEDSTSGNRTAPWLHELMAINGILFVGNVSLGNEQATRVRLVPNPERGLPESLAPLTKEDRLANLTGFQPHPHEAQAGGPGWVLP